MRRAPAYPVFLFMSAAEGFLFSLVVTVNLVYQATVVGLDPLQLVLVGTGLELSVLLFEVPTGVVADVYSRRLSVTIGYALIGLGFLLEGSIPQFAVIVLGQMTWGLGYTFISGAQEAWIADELTASGSSLSLSHVYLRGVQVAQVGALLAIGISIVLAMPAINLPIQVGGASFILMALLLAFIMPETGFRPVPRGERSSWDALRSTLGDGLRLVRGRPILLTMLLLALVYGLYSEGLDRLWTPHLLDNFDLPEIGRLGEVAWFGIIRAVGMLMTIGATQVATRRLVGDHEPRVVRALAWLTAALVVALLIFALTRNLAIALAAFWVITMLRRTIGPLFTGWLNLHLESGVRATVISMTGLADAVGQIAGGPPVGLIGTALSIRAALVTSAAILSPALALLMRTLGTLRRETGQGD